MSERVLDVEGLEAGYGEVQVLWGVSLGASSGQLTTIVGANGVGKTTTLRAVAGTLRPWGGRVRFKGEDVTRLSPHDKAARGLVLVPEGRQLFNSMTVEENLEMGAYTSRASRGFAGRLQHVYSLFPRLKERRQQRAGTLSGGEGQMLSIARALMSRPRFLMLDEPSLGIMPRIVDSILDVLQRLHQQEGLTVLLVEQNVPAALAAAERGYVLQTGRIVAEGPSRSLLDSDLVRRAYLGI